MKLQLFIEDQELDLTGAEVFPLNKTFENLFNPTDIIVDYSKSINVPITLNNNKILGNSYRLDRAILVNNTTNIGMYLDPNKRIPMKLVYNNEVVLDGYAKFVSSTSSIKNNYYTLNLFGVLGDIFNKLRNVAVSIEDVDETLENPEQYVINDYSLDHSDNTPTIFDNSFVADSWQYDDINTGHPSGDYVNNIYGAAPTYCGFYPDFESNRVQWTDTQSSLIEDELRETWKQKYYANNGIDPEKPTDAQKEQAETWVDGLDPSGFVGDGFRDYQMGDYRAYKQRPFIYFNKLLYMFKDKLEELSNYKLELDTNWFNANNPYWAKLCYMFDFLQKDGDENYQSLNLIEPSQIRINQSISQNDTNRNYIYSRTIRMGITGSTTTTGLITNPFNLSMDLLLDKSLKSFSDVYTYANESEIRLWKWVGIKVDISCGNSTHTFYSSGSSLSYFESVSDLYNGGLWVTDWSFPTADNYLPLLQATDNMVEGWQNRLDTVEWFHYIPIPAMAFEGAFEVGDEMTITVSLGTRTALGSSSDADRVGRSLFHGSNSTRNDDIGVSINIYGNNTGTGIVEGELSINVLPITYRNPWYNVPVGLKSFYKKEDPLFNVILEYTKMFGLVWSVDYSTQTIKLQRREELFKNYQIEDWSSKLDKSHDMIVEPVAFPTKYIRFGYDETDGYRYSSYKESYNVEYGDKIVKTGYEFNSDDANLLEGLSPSMSSNRNFITYMDALHWDTLSNLKATTDYIQRLECADKDNAAPIQSCKWCLRGKNVGSNDIDKKCYITNDTPLMLAEGKSYYIDPRAIAAGYIEYPIAITHYGLPLFSPVYKDTNLNFSTYNTYYSCLFNTPYVDYTADKSFLNAKGRTIYDLFWNQFINERYNVQNKKVTAYFNLDVVDYNLFKFNKFVSIENQLFMVNKIIDFNPTNNKSTKCELIQIYNPNSYTNSLVEFPYIMVNTDMYDYSEADNAYLIYTPEAYADFDLACRCYPSPVLDIRLKAVDGLQVGDDEYEWLVQVEDYEHIDDNTHIFYIVCDLGSYGVHQANFDIIFNSGDNTVSIPFSVQYK